ncbi:hypothetical protein ACP6PL_21800 [Dapis sp. BLCC M126]|uniref:hypothetical protein n=1 Tax=Dapis sp. BLCC M126 TaxID=3400189 RepID=UPI003CEB05A7
MTLQLERSLHLVNSHNHYLQDYPKFSQKLLQTIVISTGLTQNQHLLVRVPSLGRLDMARQPRHPSTACDWRRRGVAPTGFWL